jgi:hypothetical protein
VADDNFLKIAYTNIQNVPIPLSPSFLFLMLVLEFIKGKYTFNIPEHSVV